ncbi:hypothetical protein DPEC_G00311680 [Dallia pectoralis]|uniref:Uncharacterized protein n=1 Tax=Dallia pectoralis TaxID=75939 RepID=A0ACC2FBD8_DALPE|nr:hypothetical protein DPEC_G00311680 [Dallia pectoralis]
MKRSPGNGAHSPGNEARSPGNSHGARSRSSVCSEGPESKRNVNFGLATKKSIIHPRSDSCNRSTRFSLSSEKSYPNHLSACSHSRSGRDAVLNDDIQKRVLVNKDGSLSVEMRVRFRLHSDETLKWSTEIKKSPPDSLTKDCCPVRDAQPHYLQQGQSESCLDPDSDSCVAEAANYLPKPPQRSLEDHPPHCGCCYQRQAGEYNFWENPAHIQTSKHSHAQVRHAHSSSSSSSCRSSRVVRRRAIHRHCSKHRGVVQECCVREEVQQRVEMEQDGGMVVCTVSRCCSRSELNLSGTDNQGEERPLSNSSHVLQALQEDADELPHRASICCQQEPHHHPLVLTQRSPSHMATTSSERHIPALTPNPQAEEGRKGEEERSDKCAGRASGACSQHSCTCCGGEATSQAAQDRAASQASHRSRSSHISKSSQRSRSSRRIRSPSNRIRISVAPEEGDDEDEERMVSVMSTHTGLSGSSAGTIGSRACQHCRVYSQGSSPISGTSQRSHCSKRSKSEDEKPGSKLSGGSGESGFSQRTNRSNCTRCSQEGHATSGMSCFSQPDDGEVDTGKHREEEKGKEGGDESGEDREKEERAASALSDKDPFPVRTSRQASESPANLDKETGGDEKQGEEGRGDLRSASAMSAKSKLSDKSSRSHKSNCSKVEKASSQNTAQVSVTEEGADKLGEQRALSAISTKSDLSTKSRRFHRPTCNGSLGVVSSSSQTPEAKEPSRDDETEERSASPKSAKSNLTTCKSQKSNCSKAENALNTAEDPASDEAGDEAGEHRALSAISAKSNLSAKSRQSHRSTCNVSTRAVAPKPAACQTCVSDTAEEVERAVSAMSTKTNASAKSGRPHTSSCGNAERHRSLNSAPATGLESAGDDEVRERSASVMSAKNASLEKSERPQGSVRNGSTRGVSPSAEDILVITTTRGDETVGDAVAAEDTVERSASAILAKTTASVKSSRSGRSTCSRRANASNSKIADLTTTEMPKEDKGKEEKERLDSVTSAKSEASAKSSKSQRLTCSGFAGAVSPVARDIPAIETTVVNGEGDQEGERTAEERPASALSAKSYASAKSSRSQKSTRSKKAESQTTETAVAETTGEDEKGEMTERTNTAMSAKSNTLVKTGESNCNCVARANSPAPTTATIPVIETTEVDGKGEKIERTASALSATLHKSSKSQESNGSNRIMFPHLKKERLVSPTSSTRADDIVRGSVSTKLKSKQDCSVLRPLSPASHAEVQSTRQTLADTTADVGKTNPKDDHVRDNVDDKKVAGVHSKSSAKAPWDSRPVSLASGGLTKHEVNTDKVRKALEDDLHKTSGFLEVIGQGHRFRAQSDTSSAHSGKASKTENTVKDGNSRTKSSHTRNSCPSKVSKTPVQSEKEDISDSLLSQSLSAADLLRDNIEGSCLPVSPQSKVSQSDSGKVQKTRKTKQEEAGLEELDPLCLPNTSPHDVVSDWLRGIPAESGMENPEDDISETIEETEVKEAEKGREETHVLEVEETEAQEEEVTEVQEVKDIGQERKATEKNGGEDTEVAEEEETENKALSQELPLSCHSSVAVMKVLLSPSIGRCQSLPEISPVYGRRLSSAAKGLLDCLARLELIDPPPSPAAGPSLDRDCRYQQVMSILESLWWSNPNLGEGKEDEGEKEEVQGNEVGGAKERLKDSGVDLSCSSAGSGGSGKSRPDDSSAVDFTPIAEEGGEVDADGGEGEAQCRGGEVGGGKVEAEGDSTAYKSPTDTERYTTEDNTSSGTPLSVQRAPLTKRVSQDPDPVWVLNLLKKLEKQFMTHYVDAMSEFKVRWDLDDSAMLNAMITELKDEVRNRIQKSIERELRKIQGRAGRLARPRPPLSSRESTATDQRRRRLKVSKLQSVNQSDRDQGSNVSEDDYCPCDACVQKKAEAQQTKLEAVVAAAPVIMAFDLRKILMMKNEPEPPEPPSVTEGNNNNLQKETEEDVIPTVVIEDEEGEKEEEQEEKDEEIEAEDQSEDDGVEETRQKEEKEERGESAAGGVEGEDEEAAEAVRCGETEVVEETAKEETAGDTDNAKEEAEDQEEMRR